MKGMMLAICFGTLILCVLLSGCASLQQKESKEITVFETVEVTDEELFRKAGMTDEQVEHLNKVLPYDREIFAKSDIPEEQLSTTPTDKLWWHFSVSTPMYIHFGLYDNPNKGITRATRGSRTLSTLISREDMIEAIVKAYSEVPIEPEKMRDYGIESAGKISMALHASDQLLMYPPVFEKTKGHERELLSHLCQRYRRMTRVNQRYEKMGMGEYHAYSAVFNTTKTLALRFLERLDPQAYDNWKEGKIEDEPLLFNTIEEVLSRQE